MRTIAIHSDEDIELEEYDSFDEALAAVLTTAPEGSIVVVHTEDCQIEDDEDQCTCEPLEFRPGAQA